MAIYFGCPDKDYPVGGIRAIYRHVDILNRNGLEAFVLHRLALFRCTWFENETRVAYQLRYPSMNRSLPARALRRAKRNCADTAVRYARLRSPPMAPRRSPAASKHRPSAGPFIAILPSRCCAFMRVR